MRQGTRKTLGVRADLIHSPVFAFPTSRQLSLAMPFNTPEGRGENLRRARAREERLLSGLVSLMNDTKWREVFTILVKQEIWFQLELIDWQAGKLSDLQRQYHPTVFLENPNGFVDGVVSSGSFFWEIRRVRCPGTIPGRLVLSSRDHVQDLKTLVASLEYLGKLPLKVADDYLEIRGYSEIAKGQDA